MQEPKIIGKTMAALHRIPQYMVLVCCMGFLVFGYAQEGRVSQLRIDGLKKTKEGSVLKLLLTKEGALLDSLLLQKDLTRIQRLPAVADVTYRVRRTPSESYEVVYRVTENFTLIPFANLFSSANDDFAFRVGLQEFNLLGRNITLGAFYQLDVFDSYGASLRAPYLFSPKWGLAINYNDFNTQEPVFFENATADYSYRNRGFELLGLFEANFHNRFEFGFSLFNEEYQYLSGATQVGVPLTLNVDKHLLKFIYDYDGLSYFYYFLDGFRSQLNFQYVAVRMLPFPSF